MRILVYISLIISMGLPCYALDQMRIRIRTELPPNVITVGQAAQYYASAVGYRLIKNSDDSKKIANEQLNPMVIVKGVRPIEDAILMLLREDCFLIIDHEHRLFSFSTKKIEEKKTDVPGVTQNVSEEGKEPLIPQQVQPGDSEKKKGEMFVKFEDDSDSAFDKNILVEFIEKTPIENQVLIIGHSHGNSAVGVADLATRRAERVRKYLSDNGYKSVQTMASWGDEYGTPNCGVSLYDLGRKKNNGE